mmetsp:Transcript_12455/g.16097  ORF Transcript_12455/g.16097 Transcript_12455/m.16097 type:complete len:135 (+) Transcript_12455:2-406(+)
MTEYRIDSGGVSIGSVGLRSDTFSIFTSLKTRETFSDDELEKNQEPEMPDEIRPVTKKRKTYGELNRKKWKEIVISNEDMKKIVKKNKPEPPKEDKLKEKKGNVDEDQKKYQRQTVMDDWKAYKEQARGEAKAT